MARLGARNRKVYSANNGSSLPGTLKRSEGQAATTDTDVNAAYDGTGATYEAYKKFWGDGPSIPLAARILITTSAGNGVRRRRSCSSGTNIFAR